MTATDSFQLAFRTVRGNKLRTGITVAIIAFGIMALIGIITSIQAMNQSLKESFSSMGANSFSIRYKTNIRFGRREVIKTVRKGQKENPEYQKEIDDYTYFFLIYHNLPFITLTEREDGERVVEIEKVIEKRRYHDEPRN